MYRLSREWRKGFVNTPAVWFYVAQRPGDGGADWGYVTDPSKARPMSRYWMRRFRRDMQRVSSPYSVMALRNEKVSA